MMKNAADSGASSFWRGLRKEMQSRLRSAFGGGAALQPGQHTKRKYIPSRHYPAPPGILIFNDCKFFRVPMSERFTRPIPRMT
jgi:hypothetical protein